MADPLLPSARQPIANTGGLTTNPFYVWFSAVDRALRSGTLSVEGLVAQIAAMTAQIEAIEPGLPLSTTVVGSPGIGVSGSLAAGAVILAPDHDLGAVEGLSTFGVAVRTASDAWTTRALTGTLNRITITNGDGVAGAPTFDIAATYAGQASITTLGTITTGEWNATRITNANLAQINSKRFKGRTTGGVGDVEDLSVGTVQGMLGVAAPLAAMTLVGNNTGASATAQAALTVAEVRTMLNVADGATAYTDAAARAAVVIDSIADSDTDHAPSRNAVFDALAAKAPLANPSFTGDATFDTSTLKVDGTNNWVGVGTATPARSLHVVGPDGGVASYPSAVIGTRNILVLENNHNCNIAVVANPANSAGFFYIKSGAAAFSGSIQYVFSTDVLTMYTAGAAKLAIDATGHTTPASDNAQNLGSASLRWASTYSRLVYIGAGTAFITSGTGTPEGVVVAPVGSIFTRTDGGAATTLYVKTSGTGNTGWTAK